MANTRQAAKRARLAIKRRDNNRITRASTRTAVKKAFQAFEKGDKENAKAAYVLAVKSLAKAASAGAIPAGRAARKTSRLTTLARKTMPECLPFKATALKSTTATASAGSGNAAAKKLAAKKKQAAKKKASVGRGARR